MRSALRLGAILCALFLFAATSHSDHAAPPSLPPVDDAIAEPTTSAPITPAPGSESPPRDPFTPYSIGGVRGWRYDELTPAERVVADRGRDTKGWDKIQDAFATAVAERARLATAGAAEHQLGVENLAGTGVVP